MKIYPNVIFLITLFTISACNLPSSPPTPEDNLVETAVANTLTSQPIRITPLQTNTLPVQSTETITPELTITPTDIFTDTPTATLEPQNPKTTLGNPTKIYTFDDGVAFGLEEPYDDGMTTFSVANGKLVMSSQNTNGYRGWRLTSPRPENFYLEGAFQTLQCSGKDQYGLVFRAEDYTSGIAYYLAVSCDGSYKLTKWTDSGTSTLKDWTFTDILISGAYQSNLIGVYAQDDNIIIYFNDRKVDELKDSSLTAGGHFGVFIAGEETMGFTVEVDSMSYWERP
jgi:hypothetical protein